MRFFVCDRCGRRYDSEWKGHKCPVCGKLLRTEERSPLYPMVPMEE